MARVRGDASRGRREGWLIARPFRLLAALDAAGIALAAASLAQLGNPDIFLHVVWIVLALEAFIFGARIATLRIVVATLFVVAYAVIADADTPLGAGMADLDLEEWPLMAVIAVIVAIMADRVTEAGRRYAVLYRAASDRLLTAQEDERRRLAADLHDGVGQTMTALALTLDAAESALADPAAPAAAAKDAIGRAREMTGMALEDVRGVATRLRPARLQEAGLVAALGELSGSAGLPVEFVADPWLVRPGLVDPATEVDIYRIVQEALGNASRHAHARRVRVSVRQIDGELRVEVADDGVGFEPGVSAGLGLGLASMHDRAEAIGGSLDIRSRRGIGTVVRVDVPLSDTVQGGLPGSAADLTGAEAMAR